MADNVYEYLQGRNKRAVDLLDRNHSLAGFIAKTIFYFDNYCREKGLDPYRVQLEDEKITPTGTITARIGS